MQGSICHRGNAWLCRRSEGMRDANGKVEKGENGGKNEGKGGMMKNRERNKEQRDKERRN